MWGIEEQYDFGIVDVGMNMMGNRFAGTKKKSFRKRECLGVAAFSHNDFEVTVIVVAIVG